MKKRRKVALLIESSRAYGRGLLDGIGDFARTLDGWLIYHHERLLSEGIPTWFKNFEIDGVIVRTDNKDAFRYVTEMGLPFVDLRASQNDPDVYVVETDDQLVARMAADHLLERGHRRFAYCGFQGAIYSARRLKFFRSYLAEKGFEIHVYETTQKSAAQGTSNIESAGLVGEPGIIEWLNDLPKPMGLLSCNDVRGTQVLNFCQAQQIVVPEEIAVIGVDNDEVICNLANPPLTSVKNNTRLIGYRAAELLQALFDGQLIENRLHLIPPEGIEARVSTGATAISDEIVVRALFYIREHACDGIEVTNVVDAVPVSRATLERRFKKATSRSLNEEITRVRIARIKQLLTETDLKLSAVARMTGFAHAEYLSALFKKETGITPGQYRSNNCWQ